MKNDAASFAPLLAAVVENKTAEAFAQAAEFLLHISDPHEVEMHVRSLTNAVPPTSNAAAVCALLQTFEKLLEKEPIGALSVFFVYAKELINERFADCNTFLCEDAAEKGVEIVKTLMSTLIVAFSHLQTSIGNLSIGEASIEACVHFAARPAACFAGDGVRSLCIRLQYAAIVTCTAPQASAAMQAQSDALLGVWLAALRDARLAAGAVLAVVNLCACLLCQRPQLVPAVLPALLSLHESPPKALTALQWRSVQHALKLQLLAVSRIDALPACIAPCIEEALVELGVGRAAATSKGLSRRRVAAAAAAAAERLKRSRAEDDGDAKRIDADEEAAAVDVAAIPLAWAVQLVVDALAQVSRSTLQTACRAWQPPAAASVARSPSLLKDPRRMAAAAASTPDLSTPSEVSGGGGTPGKTAATAAASSPKGSGLLPQDAALLLFGRVLKAENAVTQFGVREKWASLLTKLTIFLSDGASSSPVKDAFMSFLFEDFRSRIDLAIFWLHKEWIGDYLQQGDENAPASAAAYPSLFRAFLARLDASASAKDKTFCKFLTDAPNLLDYTDVLQLVRRYCGDAERASLGLYTLKELIVSRPASRPVVLPLFLEFCFGNAPELRRAAVSLAAKHLAFAAPIVEAAVKKIGVYARASKDVHVAELPLPVALEAIGLRNELPPDLTYVACTDLFFEICTQNIAIVTQLAPFYVAASDVCRLFMRNSVTLLAEKILHAAATSKKRATIDDLLGLLPEFPAACESVVLRVIAASPTRETYAVVRRLFDAGTVSASALLPLFGVLQRDADVDGPLIAAVSHIVACEGTDERLAIEIVARLVDAKYTLFTPVDLLAYFHGAEETLGLRTCIACVQRCVAMPQIFTYAVFAAFFQRCLEAPHLPTLFMRTVIQAVSVYRRALTPLVVSILTRLANKRVWQDAKLWEGFVRCVKCVAPASFPVVLQLPVRSFEACVRKVPELAAALRDFVAQQPPSLRHRLTKYVEILNAVK